MVCGVFQQIKNIHHSSFLYENSDFPTFFPETFSSCVCHQGAYRFGSPVYYEFLIAEMDVNVLNLSKEEKLSLILSNTENSAIRASAKFCSQILERRRSF